MKKFLAYVAVMTTLVIVSEGCQKDEITSSDAREYNSEFIRDYYTLQCKVTKETEGFFPPQAARAFAYTGIALYEAVRFGIPEALSMGGQLKGLSENALPQIELNKEYNWGLVANAAVAEVMRKMYELKITPDNLGEINLMEQNNRNDLSSGSSTTTIDISVQLGKEIADAIC